MIREMQASVVYWLKAAYRANEPTISSLAHDATPAEILQKAIKKLAARWQKRFDEFSLHQATEFSKSALGYSDTRFQKALKDAGLTVKFQMSAPMRNAYQAVLQENVGLIKSIAPEYFTEVEGLVMRSVQHGRDLGFLTKELEARYGITRRRAALIARDQNNKATAVMTRVRQQEVGVTQAKWMHSHAGRHPRPSHVAADGKIYDVAKGFLIDGEWIWPGEKINCRCYARAIVPGFT